MPDSVASISNLYSWSQIPLINLCAVFILKYQCASKLWIRSGEVMPPSGPPVKCRGASGLNGHWLLRGGPRGWRPEGWGPRSSYRAQRLFLFLSLHEPHLPPLLASLPPIWPRQSSFLREAFAKHCQAQPWLHRMTWYWRPSLISPPHPNSYECSPDWNLCTASRTSAGRPVSFLAQPSSTPWAHIHFHTHTFPLSFRFIKHQLRRRQWQPTPVLLPGESQGQRSLVSCRLWGPTQSDTTDTT